MYIYNSAGLLNFKMEHFVFWSGNTIFYTVYQWNGGILSFLSPPFCSFKKNQVHGQVLIVIHQSLSFTFLSASTQSESWKVKIELQNHQLEKVSKDNLIYSLAFIPSSILLLLIILLLFCQWLQFGHILNSLLQKSLWGDCVFIYFWMSHA